MCTGYVCLKTGSCTGILKVDTFPLHMLEKYWLRMTPAFLLGKVCNKTTDAKFKILIKFFLALVLNFFCDLHPSPKKTNLFYRRLFI